MSESSRAVFLSYASQDAPAAARLCEALRDAGLEVWFDKSELRSGDAWNASIRRQIRTCALVIPIISANTEARAEGYFRREWNLAAERMLDMADDHPFLLPVVLDGTAESSARVPDAFRERQWTRCRDGAPPAEFVEHLRRLIGLPGSCAHPSSAPAPFPESGPVDARKDVAQPAGQRLKINLKRIERIPAARSSSGILLFLVFSCAFGVATAMSIVWLSGTWAKAPFRIHHSELLDARRVTAALMPPSTENADLWKLLSVRGKQELARLLKEGSRAEDELKTVLAQEFNALIEGTLALDNSAAPSGEGLALSNRRLLESRFQDDLSTLLEPRSLFSRARKKFLERQEFRWLIGGVAFIFIAIGVTCYFVYRPVAIRYRFDDLRHMDQALEYLMGELGFRESAHRDGTRFYRPNVSTFVVWGPVSFTARIDGASIVVSGPSMLMKRFTRALEAFITTDSAVAV